MNRLPTIDPIGAHGAKRVKRVKRATVDATAITQGHDRGNGDARALGPWLSRRRAEVAHVNVTVPDELVAAAKARGLCFSQLLQSSLRAIVDCDHGEDLTCRQCGEAVDRIAVEHEALSRFCSDVFWELDGAVGRGITGEGAARIVKSIAERHDTALGNALRLPRPTRAERESWREAQDPYPRRRAS